MGPVAAISGPMGPVHSVDEWADIIRRDLGNAIDSIIRAGTHLMQAKHQLGKGPYGDMLKAVKLHERTARRLIAIAENRVLTNPEYHARLPVSMRTLSELAEIPAPMLEGYIKDGIVNVDMERSEVETLRKSRRRAAEATGEKPLSELERTKQALAQALQENHQLKERTQARRLAVRPEAVSTKRDRAGDRGALQRDEMARDQESDRRSLQGQAAAASRMKSGSES